MHVCRRWRELVFASPRRLNLRIPCTRRNLVVKNLGIWPAVPIDVDDNDLQWNITQDDNILAALKHVDRVYHVRLSLSDLQALKMATAMQEPFPVLTRLFLTSEWDDDAPTPSLPANFLGGSVPRLQAIGLCSISYPALPTLLLSASDLVKLDLKNIPLTGLISPEAIVAPLAALPKLEIFVMEFARHAYYYDRDRVVGRPPITRTILPALAYFVFRGGCKYLEDLVGRIDGPRLNHISITTPYRPVGFQVAQLSRFIDQSVGPELAQWRNAEVSFSYYRVDFHFFHRPDDSGQDRTTVISYKPIHWGDTQVLSQLPVTLSNVVHLQITSSPDINVRADQVDLSIPFFQLIRQFPAMQTLLIDSRLSWFAASILGHTPEVMMIEAFPSLELLCLEECYYQHSLRVDKFVAARRHSDHPVTIVNTNKEFRKILESYISKNG